MGCTRDPSTGDPIPEASLSNWSGEVTANPVSIFQPSTVDEVVAIVREAEGRRLAVHAVGSAWSFNDNFSTSGFLIRTDSLNRILSNTMGATAAADVEDPSGNDPVFQALTGRSRMRKLVHVEAGIKVHVLHDTLEQMRFVGGMGRPHGFALATLGGSGGQSLAGVVSTSTHGGDVALGPIADLVQGIHLVAPGGAEFFLQRGGVNAIVDTNRLAQTLPCVAGRIISDDKAFDAVLVSLGRMGVIYSLVVEVVDQFILEENRFKTSWNSVSASLRTNSANPPDPTMTWRDPNANRFLQVVILPYANGSGDHDCFVSLRSKRDGNPPLNPASTGDLFSWACELQPLEKSLVILGIIAALDAAAIAAGVAAAAVSWIPVVGEVAAAAAVAASAAAAAATIALAPLLVPSITIGDWIAAVTNVMTKFGLFGVATDVVNTLIGSGLSPHDVTDLSYRIMDTYDYRANCYKARSLEVAFNADDTRYLDYIDRVFSLIDSFKSQSTLYGGYISLRYCAKGSALLAIERWTHTVCIEMSALSGLASESGVLNAFELAAAQMGAAIHWGQLNNRMRPDIEAVWADTIEPWRETLERTAAHGSLTTFDNAFCQQRGLEPDGRRRHGRPVDLSYLVPLLLS
jgi:hypothetical protein